MISCPFFPKPAEFFSYLEMLVEQVLLFIWITIIFSCPVLQGHSGFFVIVICSAKLYN